jgi:hypothetical protein
VRARRRFCRNRRAIGAGGARTRGLATRSIRSLAFATTPRCDRERASIRADLTVPFGRVPIVLSGASGVAGAESLPRSGIDVSV